MDHEVLISQDGRGGTIYYREGDAEMDFWWEFSMSGVLIGVPSPAQWNAVCDSHKTPGFKDRRDEILESIAQGVCQQQSLAPNYKISDGYIDIYF